MSECFFILRSPESSILVHSIVEQAFLAAEDTD